MSGASLVEACRPTRAQTLSLADWLHRTRDVGLTDLQLSQLSGVPRPTVRWCRREGQRPRPTTYAALQVARGVVGELDGTESIDWPLLAQLLCSAAGSCAAAARVVSVSAPTLDGLLGGDGGPRVRAGALAASWVLLDAERRARAGVSDGVAHGMCAALRVAGACRALELAGGAS